MTYNKNLQVCKFNWTDTCAGAEMIETGPTRGWDSAKLNESNISHFCWIRNVQCLWKIFRDSCYVVNLSKLCFYSFSEFLLLRLSVYNIRNNAFTTNNRGFTKKKSFVRLALVAFILKVEWKVVLICREGPDLLTTSLKNQIL